MARRKPKIIDTWTIIVPMGSLEGGDYSETKVDVPVRIQAGDFETTFVVDFEYGEHKFVKHDKDINRLRAATRDWLKGVVTFEWEDYFYVEFVGVKDDDREEKEIEVRVNFQFRHYQLAKNVNGDEVYRDLSRHMNSGRVTKGRPTTGDDETSFGFHHDKCTKTLVKKTEESEKVLRAIADGFGQLCGRLERFLHPEGIDHRLTMAAGKPLILELKPGADDAETD